jgi:signal peptidase I
MRRFSDDRRSRPRWLVERAVFVLVAVFLWQTWYLDGLFVPCQVTSGSMAGCLSGPHRRVVCEDCGYRFEVDAEVEPPPPRAVCPNCGYAGNDPAAYPRLPGDRVVLDKSVFRLRPPRRWEVAAFRHPRRAEETAVKRVVGLPGESVQVRDGDVYVEGQIQRKAYWEQKALAVLVHDANLAPSLLPAPPTRWEPEGDWGAAGGRFAHPGVHDDEPIHWLVYRHWHRTGPGGDQAREGPVTDVCGRHQPQPRREEDVHPVADLMLSLRVVQMTGSGSLIVRATDGREEFEVRFHPQKSRYEVLQNDRPVPAAQGKLPPWSRGLSVDVSLFDRQFLLAFDGRPAVVWPYDPSERPLRPTSRPFAVGARGLWVVVEDLKVYRDVYYTRPRGFEARPGLAEPIPLGPDEYYVLGDFSAISEDSRNWAGPPGVPERLLVGKPLVVIFPATQIEVGNRAVQVPDLSRIRYIR